MFQPYHFGWLPSFLNYRYSAAYDRVRIKVSEGQEHVHIHSEFRDNVDRGKTRDSQHRHNKIKQWERIRDSKLTLQSARLPMWARIMRSFSTCSTSFPPRAARGDGCFYAFCTNSETLVILSVGFSCHRRIESLYGTCLRTSHLG